MRIPLLRTVAFQSRRSFCLIALLALSAGPARPARSQPAAGQTPAPGIVSRLHRTPDAGAEKRRAAPWRNDLEERRTYRRSLKTWPVQTRSHPVATGEQDSLALIALFQSAGGLSWTNRSGWLADPVPSWHGVTVDENGRVIAVDLNDNGLFGTLPPDIGRLDALQSLDLSDNLLTGAIPPELFTLTGLQVLDLSSNALTGPLAEAAGDLTSLTHLILWGNNLSGPIPASIGGLLQLQELWLFQNQFDGPIPESIGALEQLNRLYLDQNRLTGPIPTALAHASSLSELFLDFNALTGSIPPELSTLSNLVALSLGHNLLDGDIPEELGDLQRLKVLDLAGNRLTGPIPEAFSFVPSLSSLLLNDNRLTGSIPVGLGRLFGLSRLRLAGNELTGTLFETIGFDLFNLVELDVSDNALEGPLPQSLGVLGVLQILDVSNNQFSGELPLFGLNFDLREVYLNDNAFSGEIGDVFASLELLQALDLSGNQLTGPVPRTMGVHTILQSLNLSRNELTGELPDTIERLTSLERLDLWSNRLSGPLPAALGSLPALQVVDLGNNAFSGEIPGEIGQLASLVYLLLDENDLSGAVPASFRQLQNLAGLTVKNNALDELPDLTPLVALDTVDVSGNRFTFEDLEPNVGLAGGAFSYAPQAPVPTIVDPVDAGTRYRVRVGGSANRYAWQRNGAPAPAETAAEWTLQHDAGAPVDTLHCLITNAIVAGLTIESLPVRTDAVLERIVIVPDSARVASGDSIRFAFEGFDQTGAPHFFTPVWTAGGGSIGDDGWYVAGDTSGTYTVRVRNLDGSVFAEATVTVDGVVEPVHAEDDAAAQRFVLVGTYPNPFARETTIAFVTPATAPVEVRIYDVLGRTVARHIAPAMPAGRHTLRIDTTAWPSGLYVYRLVAGAAEATGTMLKSR